MFMDKTCENFMNKFMTIISPIELDKKLELGLSLIRILISLNKLRRTYEQT